MDFGLIALIVVGAGKVLDYVAPRTKTKVDDKIRQGFNYVLGFLPFFGDKGKALAEQVEKAEQEPPEVMAARAPNAPNAPNAPTGGKVIRDHRR